MKREQRNKITNQVNNSGKYNKSLKQSREKGFTNVAIITNIITEKIEKIRNQESGNGKYNNSLKESSERGFRDLKNTNNNNHVEQK